MDENNDDLIVLTTGTVSSNLSNNPIQGADIPALIGSVHKAVQEAHTAPLEPAREEYTPVVSVKASVEPDHLVCLECGVKQETLKWPVGTAAWMTAWPQITVSLYWLTARHLRAKSEVNWAAGFSVSGAPQ